MSRAAQSARLAKEKRPDNYCAHPRCLWREYDARTGKITRCPKHGISGDQLTIPPAVRPYNYLQKQEENS